MEASKNNLPDVLTRWSERHGSELHQPRTAQSFVVTREEIVEKGYDLSINRYREIAREAQVHRQPDEILAELRDLEREIASDLEALGERI
jgi:type I restriction enzyme M protein